MTRRILGAALGMALLTLVGKAVGLGRELTVAGAFGAGPQFDAYLVGYALPEVLSFIAFYVALYLFVPLYLQERERSPESADGFASAFLLRSSALLAGLGIVLAAGAPVWVRWVAPELDAVWAATAVHSLRILSVLLLFRGLEGGLRGLANADDRFWLPSLGALLASVVVIASVAGLGETRGVIVLAAGMAAGAAVPVVVTALPLVRSHPRLGSRPAWSHPLLARCARRLPWVVAIEACGLVRSLIDRAIASRALDDGNISALSYSGVLAEVPFQVLGLTVAALLLPEFSRLHARADGEGSARALRRGIGVGVVLMLPFAALFLVLLEPTVSAVYERGRFDAEATRLTARALWPLAVGLPAAAVAGITMQAAYASGRLRELLAVRLVALVAKLAVSLALVAPLGAAGLALGSTAFNVVVGLGLARVLLRGFGGVSRPLWTGVATAAAAAAGWGVFRGWETLRTADGLAGLVGVGAAWAAGMVVFVIVARLARVGEMVWMLDHLGRSWTALAARAGRRPG